MNALEHAARQAWRDWAVYTKWTCCTVCAELRYCGAARSRHRFLCFECFDQDDVADIDRRRWYGA